MANFTANASTQRNTSITSSRQPASSFARSSAPSPEITYTLKEWPYPHRGYHLDPSLYNPFYNEPKTHPSSTPAPRPSGLIDYTNAHKTPDAPPTESPTYQSPPTVGQRPSGLIDYSAAHRRPLSCSTIRQHATITRASREEKEALRKVRTKEPLRKLKLPEPAKVTREKKRSGCLAYTPEDIGRSLFVAEESGSQTEGGERGVAPCDILRRSCKRGKGKERGGYLRKTVKLGLRGGMVVDEEEDTLSEGIVLGKGYEGVIECGWAQEIGPDGWTGRMVRLRLRG
ncbi:hypothetical protein ACLMJK_001403 [Lecanora helva]